MDIQLKRAYDPAESADGFRVLVDRLWPRGISKEKLKLDLWDKDTAPSDELRRWFHHEGGSWEEFERRYREELAANPEALRALREALAGRKRVTLLYGAKDAQHNQAVVLRELLSE